MVFEKSDLSKEIANVRNESKSDAGAFREDRLIGSLDSVQSNVTGEELPTQGRVITYHPSPPRYVDDNPRVMVSMEAEFALPSAATALLVKFLQYGHFYDKVFTTVDNVLSPNDGEWVEFLDRCLEMEWQLGAAAAEWTYVMEPVPIPAPGTDADRDRGRAGRTLDDFCADPMAQRAGLLRPEVIALRLYTGPGYDVMNQFLRGTPVSDILKYYTPSGGGPSYEFQTLPVPKDGATVFQLEDSFVVCSDPDKTSGQEAACHISQFGGPIATCVLADRAVRKLTRLSYPASVFRGVRGTLDPQISQLIQALAGGPITPASPSRPTEVAFMSTTHDPEVAASFADKGSGLLLAMFCNGGWQRQTDPKYPSDPPTVTNGARVKWVSQYPSESEVLFPPGTVLEPMPSTSSSSFLDTLLIPTATTAVAVTPRVPLNMFGLPQKCVMKFGADDPSDESRSRVVSFVINPKDTVVVPEA